MNFDTENGALKNVQITGDFFSLKPIEEFCLSLCGVRFELSAIKGAFKSVSEFISGAKGEEIALSLFE